MQAHEIDYEIYGSDLQVVEIELDPQETVIAEAGSMSWVEDQIHFETRLGDGSKPKSGLLGSLAQLGKRAISGESLFMTHFTNHGTGKKKAAFAAPTLGKIIAVDMSTLGELTCQKGSFLCAALGTEVSFALNTRLGTGLFGGEGFILQKLRGNGKAFIHAGGTVVHKKLANETIRVDTGCLVAFGPGIDYDIERVKGLRSMFFGGEGLFLVHLKGSGSVYLQSLPFTRLAKRILQNAPGKGSKWKRGEGSFL